MIVFFNNHFLNLRTLWWFSYFLIAQKTGVEKGIAEEVAEGCSVKKMFLEISKIHRKTPMPESLFYKVAGLRPTTLLKKRLWHRCFSVNFEKFLRTPLLIKYLWWLRLALEKIFPLSSHSESSTQSKAFNTLQHKILLTSNFPKLQVKK